MLGPGPLIAIDVILLYTILGPLVLFAVYVLFDFLSRPGKPVGRQPGDASKKKDPALWINNDIDAFWDQI